MRLVWLVVAVLAIASCGKGDRKTCEAACRNFATLQFWSEWNPKIEAEPEAERAKLRREKIVELEHKLAQGIDQCVASCQNANNEDQYNCMAEAKTWAEANACAETEEQAK